MTSMKKFFILILPLIILSITVCAQDSYIKDRWNIKIGYSEYTSMLLNVIPEKNDNYRIELNYGFHDEIEFGIYFGLSKMEVSVPGSLPGSFESFNPKTYFYGINCNYNLLPLIIKEDDFRFDLYATGKLGGMIIHYIDQKQFEYSFGGGAAFYPLKHIGAFVEYTYGRYYYNDNKKLRYGLSIKF